MDFCYVLPCFRQCIVFLVAYKYSYSEKFSRKESFICLSEVIDTDRHIEMSTYLSTFLNHVLDQIFSNCPYWKFSLYGNLNSFCNLSYRKMLVMTRIRNRYIVPTCGFRNTFL